MKFSTYTSYLQNWRGEWVAKPLLLADDIIEQSKAPPFAWPVPVGREHHAYWWAPVLEETRRDGFVFGCVTSWENPPSGTERPRDLTMFGGVEPIFHEPGCTIGDAFIEGPNGMRAGFTWEVASNTKGAVHAIFGLPVDRPTFALLHEQTEESWGVWYFTVKRITPIRSRVDMTDVFDAIRPVLQGKYRLIFEGKEDG